MNNPKIISTGDPNGWEAQLKKYQKNHKGKVVQEAPPGVIKALNEYLEKEKNNKIKK